MKLRSLAALVVAAGLLFLASMLWFTGGHLSLPLDDSFIYLQYAKQTASGHPLVYIPGEAATSGATSLPWAGLLAVGALFGFTGKAAIPFAMILGGAAFVLLLFRMERLSSWLDSASEESTEPGALPRETTRSGAFTFATLLVFFSGPLQWATWSGMEIPLFALALAWSFESFCRSTGRMNRKLALALAVLAVVRPEGAILALVASLATFVNAFTERRLEGTPWIVLPLAAALAVPALLLLLTGDARSSGFLSKSLFATPQSDLLDLVRVALVRMRSLATTFSGFALPLPEGTGLYAYDAKFVGLWIVPGAAFFFALGAFPRVAEEVKARRIGPGTLVSAWTLLLLFVTAFLEEPDAHFGRYQMPILPLFLLFVAQGVRSLESFFREQNGLRSLGAGLRIALLAAGVLQTTFFALAFGDNCADIDRMHIRLADTVKRVVAPNEVVAVNDAGAIPYFSERRTLDLVGLTTPGFAGIWKEGSGTLYEALEELPPEKRPSWFCFFPNWFEFDGLGIWQRKGSVRLLTPSIVDAEKVLARADWTLAGSGHFPSPALADSGSSLVVLDRLDVAERGSERAHHFQWTNGERGGDAGTFARRASWGSEGGAEIIDGGRTIFDSCRFTMARSNVRATLLVLRTVSGARQRVEVSVDGGERLPVEVYAPGGGRFFDVALCPLPAGENPAAIELRLVSAAAESAPLILAHVFTVELRPAPPVP